MNNKRWSLVADIGGTNARFGLFDYASGQLQFVQHYSVAQFSQFHLALQNYLDDVDQLGQWSDAPARACLAVACPVTGEEVKFTNSPWVINCGAISRQLQGAKIDLINDFTAVGHAVTSLKPQDWHQVGGGSPAVDKPIAILGPGTGLGVCTLVPVGSGYQVVESEGGHVDFAPLDDREIAVLQILTRRFGHVSVERLLSGPGLLNIYRALTELAGKPVEYQTPEEVTHAVLESGEFFAVSSLKMFCEILGSVAGNLVLTVGGRGGVYIAGGIVPRFIQFLENSGFRERFEAKGRYKSYLSAVPVRVVTKENLGLHGTVKKLSFLEI